jgi:hypothetical protein
MFGKIAWAWNLFREGEALADPSGWHDAHNQVQRINALILLVISGLHAFGIDTIAGISVDIPPRLAFEISLAVAGVGAWFTNQITSPHAGFLPARPTAIATTAAAGAVRIESAPATLPALAPAAEAGMQSEGDATDSTAKKQAEQIFAQRG